MKILSTTILSITLSGFIFACGNTKHHNRKSNEVSSGLISSSGSRLTDPVVKTDQPYDFKNQRAFTGCADLKPSLDQKSIDVPIKFENYMGTNQDGTIKLKLDSIMCLADGKGVMLTAKKIAGTTFSTQIYIEIKDGLSTLNVIVSDCVANTVKGLLDGLKSEGTVINDAFEAQVMNNVMYEYCPLAVDGIAKAIISEIQK